MTIIRKYNSNERQRLIRIHSYTGNGLLEMTLILGHQLHEEAINLLNT